MGEMGEMRHILVKIGQRCVEKITQHLYRVSYRLILFWGVRMSCIRGEDILFRGKIRYEIKMELTQEKKTDGYVLQSKKKGFQMKNLKNWKTEKPLTRAAACGLRCGHFCCTLNAKWLRAKNGRSEPSIPVGLAPTAR